MNETQQAAAKYIERCFGIVWMKGNVPYRDNWMDWHATQADYLDGHTVDIALGSKSGGLVAVQLRHPVAVASTPRLPETHLKTADLWFYVVRDIPEEFVDQKYGGLNSSRSYHPTVAILGTRTHVPAPMSAWVEFGEPTTVQYFKLTDAVDELIEACESAKPRRT